MDKRPPQPRQRAPADLLARLADAQASLSRKMAVLARWLADHAVDAAFMNAREIAQASGVSLATVVRFPAAIGYANLDELRARIQDRINAQLTGVERLQALPAERSAASHLHRVVEGDIALLQALAGDVPERDFAAAVAAIGKAERCLVLGFRWLASLAGYLGFSLDRIRPGVETVTAGDSTLYGRIQALGPRDVVIVVLLARYPADLVAFLRFAHDRGVPIVALTDGPMSPVVPLARTALFAKSSVRDFVGSLAAPAALANALVSRVGVALGAAATRRLQMHEDAAAAAGIYVGSAGASADPDAASRRDGRRRAPRD